MSKESKLAKQLSPKVTPIGTNLILPNTSGDHVRGLKRAAPIVDMDLVNKEYVDNHSPISHASTHEATGSDQVDHDSLLGFVSNEHINWTNGSFNTFYTQGGVIQDSSTSDGRITLVDSASSIAVMHWGVSADDDLYMRMGAFSGVNNLDTKARDFKLFSTAQAILVQVNHTTGTWDFDDNNLTTTGSMGAASYTDANIDHDALNNFVANEHIDWTNATSNFLTTGSAEIRKDGVDCEFLIHEDAGTHEARLHFRRGTTDWEIINNGSLTMEFETTERFVFGGNGDLTIDGNYTGGNVTSGTDPGHDHGAGSVPDHDDLNGFIANEHLDWTNMSIPPISNFYTKGTVGIGVVAGAPLQVRSIGFANTAVIIESAKTDDDAIRFRLYNANFASVAQTFHIGIDATDEDFKISHHFALGTNDRMIIDAGTGNVEFPTEVGIGNAPTLKLDVNAKSGNSLIGGFCIKLTNKTGANSVAGGLVEADDSNDDAVKLMTANGIDPIGVFLEGGIADGSEAWVVIAGIADVAMEDNTAATRNNWVGVATGEAGYANATAASPANQTRHFQEIGHCIETVAAGGGGTHILARCILHFN